MKILVTGGTGFIGRHLTQALLSKKHQVKVLARNKEKARELNKIGAELAVGDWDNGHWLQSQLSGVEVIYHLAAIPGDYWGRRPEEYEKINVGYTRSLVEAACLAKVKRFIFCSSIQAIVGKSPYGKSKQLAEDIVKKSTLDFTIVRPAIVLGPYSQGSILKLCQKVKKGIMPLPEGGKVKQPFIFVDDLISLFLKCLQPEAKNKTYLALGEEITFKDLVGLISHELNNRCLFIPLPKTLLMIAAWPLERACSFLNCQPPLTEQQIDFITFHWHLTRTTEEQKFWQPKVKMKEGIKQTINWYKNNGYL